MTFRTQPSPPHNSLSYSIHDGNDHGYRVYVPRQGRCKDIEQWCSLFVTLSVCLICLWAKTVRFRHMLTIEHWMPIWRSMHFSNRAISVNTDAIIRPRRPCWQLLTIVRWHCLTCSICRQPLTVWTIQFCYNVVLSRQNKSNINSCVSFCVNSDLFHSFIHLLYMSSFMKHQVLLFTFMLNKMLNYCREERPRCRVC